ncbi:MAG: DUF3391 domain-containing protein, partial [Burkholderiaceae bacterium]
MNLHPSKLRSQLRISVNDVRIGMFIAELDRPWMETPFMLQGFLLKEAAHLQMLRDFVSEVMIDPTRSATDSLRHLPWDALHEPVKPVQAPAEPIASTRIVYTTGPAQHQIEPIFATLRQSWRNIFGSGSPHATSHQPAPYYLRYAEQHTHNEVADESGVPLSKAEQKATLASKLTPPSTPQFSEFITSIYPHDVRFTPLGLTDYAQLFWEKWTKPGAKLIKPRTSSITKVPPKKRPNFVPESITLVVYRDQASIAEETVRAKKVVQQADK